MSSAALVDAARRALAESADPARAPEMRRYMKSEMPYRGVPKPERAKLAKTLFAEHALPDVESWTRAVLSLWRDASFREERYLAIDLTGDRRYRPWQTPERLPLYEELIVTGAWWDYVDEIASRRVGPILRAHPEEMSVHMRRWARDADPWKRRTSIICQLGSKADTDTELLADCIEPSIGDRDFFLRKGIGWALRQHTRVDPGWVVHFVDTHPDLSPLSKREALRNL
ncbi:3-methyladenine DNA glycosylase AlkD [Herbihabitans rhizosphaerae]|uniref:3-methyladenine DNA glycosylase AlkD n=1 Tax=Herbihabitans rhizosphaerae TaxID=1872711 RepID=A0A4Q7KCW3_9PSEU|nr:DNA alkylation repair protein [Herbihabitans rhizosphaerae]RZS29768.1 3-methyladenine DNA glycosylase AlkD [Herbihabitans rhizosphaerae]